MKKRNLARVNGISRLNRNRTKIFLMIFIAFIFLGNAYSALSQTLVVAGTTEIFPEPHNSDSIEDNLERGNLDITIDKLELGWWDETTGTHPNASFEFTVTNNNDFDVTNWYADITLPGLVENTLGYWIIQQLEIINDTIYISNAEGAYSHSSIASGGHQTYNMTFSTSEDFTIEDIEAIAYTFIDTYEFKRYEYEYGPLKFVLDLKDYSINNAGLYVTNFDLSITNLTDKPIEDFGFKTNYSPVTPLLDINGEPYYKYISDTSNHLYLSNNEDDVTRQLTTWLCHYDWQNALNANETINCIINNVVTKSKVRPITISDVWYKSEALEESNTITNEIVSNEVIGNEVIGNEVSNTTPAIVHKKTDSGIIDGTSATYEITYITTEESYPDRYVTTANITFTNDTSYTIDFRSLTLNYNNELMDQYEEWPTLAESDRTAFSNSSTTFRKYNGNYKLLPNSTTSMTVSSICTEDVFKGLKVTADIVNNNIKVTKDTTVITSNPVIYYQDVDHYETTYRFNLVNDEDEDIIISSVVCIYNYELAENYKNNAYLSINNQWYDHQKSNIWVKVTGPNDGIRVPAHSSVEVVVGGIATDEEVTVMPNIVIDYPDGRSDWI